MKPGSTNSARLVGCRGDPWSRGLSESRVKFLTLELERLMQQQHLITAKHWQQPTKMTAA